MKLVDRAARSSVATEQIADSFVPIVFTHRSNSDYLRYSLQQARRSNPNSTVYLIGDESNQGHEGIEHRLISDYFEKASELAPLYRHFSSNGYATELYNLQRWFVLRDFRQQNGLRKCLYLDSDVMLFGDATASQKSFDEFDMAMTRHFVPCTVFLNDQGILEDFCQFIWEIYTRRRRHEWDYLVAWWAIHRKNGRRGGASDMTMFELFQIEYFGRIGELSLIRDGSVYDECIGESTGFEVSDGVKLLLWRDGHPYGIHRRTGWHIRFNALHCQGKHKGMMAGLYESAGRTTGSAECVGSSAI